MVDIIRGFVDYGVWEIAITILVYLEWRSSHNLDKKLGKIFGKYVTKLEETHYAIVRKLLSGRVYKKSKRNKKRDRQ